MPPLDLLLVVVAFAHAQAVVWLAVDDRSHSPARHRRPTHHRRRLGRGDLTVAGSAVWATWCAMVLTSVVWGAWFLHSLQLSPMTAALTWSAAALSLVTLPSAVIQAREGWEPLLRRRWSRPRHPVEIEVGSTPPAVCIQVPVHAEPPHLVIETLDALSRLDYPDFHVLVIDNNTADEALWRPVEAHCHRLGERFRFLHVEGLEGAKAGALNWADQFVPPRTELIALVDADYVVRPDWLRLTAGHFADPRVGFVQAPHAYRRHDASRFHRWAQDEYSVFFHTSMVSLNEHNAGLTVGTMSLIRHRALREAGGWATWCLTEDSELAIRIHAQGYDSVYLTQALGWGLIPETFEAYRKQRFRWTFGPAQELRRHWRLFLPRWLGGVPSQLTARQRLHHGNHGLDVVAIGVRGLTFPLSLAVGVSMVAHHEQPPVPLALWLAATGLTVSSLGLRWLVYRRVLGMSLRRMAASEVAFASLSHVIFLAALRAATGGRASWTRTDKFTTTRRGLRSLIGARDELVLGLAGLLGGISLIVATHGPLVRMLGIGVFVRAVTYLAAPLVAIVADRDLASPPRRLEERPTPRLVGSGAGRGRPRSDAEALSD